MPKIWRRKRSSRHIGNSAVSEQKLITVDRQTSVAVDIAGQTAAETALQNAALDLVERILPKFVK